MALSFTRRTSTAVVLGVAATSLALSACSSGTSSSSSSGSSSPLPSVSADAALAAKVPADIKSTGTLVFGSDASYAPNEFIDTDGSTVIGLDVDLGKAVAAKLGLQGEFQNANFDSIIVGVDKGKYGAGMSSFTINADREKETNMVSYLNVGTAWATQTGNPQGVSPDDACGKSVSVQKATVQADDLAKRSDKCTAAGKPAIDIQTYTLQSDATAAVVNGKAAAMLADSPVIGYAIKQSGKLEQLGDVYESAPYGIVIAKPEVEFATAVQGAVNALIADGTYQQILDQWNAGNGAIKQSELNPSAS